jgi:CheY-like chemotaxis protein
MPATSIKKPSILIVEDDPEVMRLFSETLRDGGST